MKEKILVSACFLHSGYKYNGGDNYNEKIALLQEKYDFILICPEVFGGLPTPRVASEIKEDRVYSELGVDVTNNFIDGANKALLLAKENGCKKAILKARSPSCGKDVIYDGSFTHTKIKGDGIACRLLKNNGIEVFTEDELDYL